MTEQARAAAERLWAGWNAPGTVVDLPEDVRPQDRAAGYAVQDELDQMAGARRGWKIAATGAGGRVALGVDSPLAGPLYERYAVGEDDVVELSTLRMGIVEGEFGFRIGQDLPAEEGPFTRQRVVDVIGAFVPAIEIPGTRYPDHREVGAAMLLADGACTGRYVIGQPVETFDANALAGWSLTLTGPGVEPVNGSGANVLGDPIEAVRWLADELASHGYGLKAGDYVITGAATAVRNPKPGTVTADFGELGSVSVAVH